LTQVAAPAKVFSGPAQTLTGSRLEGRSRSGRERPAGNSRDSHTGRQKGVYLSQVNNQLRGMPLSGCVPDSETDLNLVPVAKVVRDRRHAPSHQQAAYRVAGCQLTLVVSSVIKNHVSGILEQGPAESILARRGEAFEWIIQPVKIHILPREFEVKVVYNDRQLGRIICDYRIQNECRANIERYNHVLDAGPHLPDGQPPSVVTLPGEDGPCKGCARNQRIYPDEIVYFTLLSTKLLPRQSA